MTDEEWKICNRRRHELIDRDVLTREECRELKRLQSAASEYVNENPLPFFELIKLGKHVFLQKKSVSIEDMMRRFE